MSDSGLKGRVRGLFGGVPSEQDIMEKASAAVESAAEAAAESDKERQALQVLILAQRTADDHITTAQRQSEKIRSDARSAAEEITKEAQVHASEVRQEAAKTLSNAQTKAEEITRDAQTNADTIRRNGEKIFVDAQAKAAETIKEAQAHANGLERDAQQRYEDIVGTLEAKRTDLEQQIDALQRFDREYRDKLTAFMQDQLQAVRVEPMPSVGEIGRVETKSKRSGRGPALKASTAEFPQVRQAKEESDGSVAAEVESVQ